ncbi:MULTISPECIES: MotA/TolQ/ExbB proton channel family protein [unclassified Myxococcus]|jgi:biopolymer transport protein ExbB/TolQ|uniref:MotA/TolQ/ExbB proton channel family protein n=1 Tax=unclassified Myxococcus TaxID=2648731 RepID=UPI001CBF63BA|nr:MULTISPECIES: MotA/TolQ/ExbB proton channel family protein [unclassified Myxococcus]MBZ4401382.1 MotA/TolQ/ExbB proton channel family protein [Myxococcus sp. AS-1-15]MBZ4414162.1 MotA/TolQ/ExbB proton channel family protein [Myxococcus sp. XM-1-1-1]
MSLNDILHYLRLGGVTLALLLLASVAALVVAVERIIALWGVSERSRLLGEAVSKHLLRGDVAAARTAAERSDSVAADIFLAGFDRWERSRGSGGAGVEAAVERERAQVGLKLRRNLWILATIGSITPFVGLFGTVAGIMRSFKDLGLDVEAGGTGGSAAVMTGISEALVATAVGILVAVQAMVFYNYFQARLSRVLVELRLMGDEFAELLKERAAGGPPPEPRPESPSAPRADSQPA